MHSINKAGIRSWLRAIRATLNQEWAPIEDCPEDEYDTYADKLASMIIHGAEDNELMRYLESAEVEYIGLGPSFDLERGHRVVAALRLLGSPKSN